MFLNIPSILLLDRKIDKFRPKASKFYKELEKKNVVFYNSKKAANFIKKINHSVDDWWLDKDLQKLG